METRIFLAFCSLAALVAGCGLGDEPGLRVDPFDAGPETVGADVAVDSDFDTAMTAIDSGDAETDVSVADAPSWPTAGSPWRAPADFDKNKQTDVFCHGNKDAVGHEGELLVGLASAAAAPTWTTTPFIDSWCTGNSSVGSGDFNGDGISDLYCLDVTGISATIALSDGATFKPKTTKITSFWCFPDSVLVADVDHDGRDDFVCHNGSHDPGGDDPSTWVIGLDSKGVYSKTRYWLNGWCSWRGSTAGLGDFDGDGNADIWCHDTTSSMFHGSTWIAKAGSEKFEPVNGDKPVLESFCDQLNNKFGSGDFDGDGHADFYCHASDTGKTKIALSRGFTSYSISEWGTTFCSGSGKQFGTGDFDGDHRTDFYCHDPMTGTTFAYSDEASKSLKIAPGTLTGCTYPNHQFGTTAN